MVVVMVMMVMISSGGSDSAEVAVEANLPCARHCYKTFHGLTH